MSQYNFSFNLTGACLIEKKRKSCTHAVLIHAIKNIRIKQDIHHKHSVKPLYQDNLQQTEFMLFVQITWAFMWPGMLTCCCFSRVTWMRRWAVGSSEPTSLKLVCLPAVIFFSVLHNKCFWLLLWHWHSLTESVISEVFFLRANLCIPKKQST